MNVMTLQQKASVKLYSVMSIVIFCLIMQVRVVSEDWVLSRQVCLALSFRPRLLCSPPLLLPIQAYFWAPLMSIFYSVKRRHHVSGQGAAIDTPFRSVFGISPYVPLISAIETGRNEFWLAADLVNVPHKLLPLTKGFSAEECNLASAKELPGYTAGQISEVFR